jgi:hypothetical protein
MDVLQEIIEQGNWFGTPQSSNVMRLRYMKESGTLIIQFKGGQHYRYDNVPKSLAIEFLNSPSKGKFFLSRVKNSHKGTKCDANGLVAPLPGKII